RTSNRIISKHDWQSPSPTILTRFPPQRMTLPRISSLGKGWLQRPQDKSKHDKEKPCSNWIGKLSQMAGFFINSTFRCSKKLSLKTDPYKKIVILLQSRSRISLRRSSISK